MSNKTICIIEDNRPIRILFSVILQKAGYEVLEFDNGESALKWLNENKCFGIITDILLPDISGKEVLNLVRKSSINSKIPAIAVTGVIGNDDREKYIGMGFDHYITKPIDVSTFINEVSAVFNKQ